MNAAPAEAATVRAMGESAGMPIGELRVDVGPTCNAYLMQFRSDMLNIPDSEALSGIGAGLAVGAYSDDVFNDLKRTSCTPAMDEAIRDNKYQGAVRRAGS